MSDRDYAEQNRAAWNEVAPIHRRGRKLNLLEAVRAPEFNVLDDVEREMLARLGLEGKRVAQVCCNNGRELISIVKMGAASGVGFDISDAFVAEAQELAAAAQAPCAFVRSNALEIPACYAGQFHLVFISVGALTWIAKQDLPRFFQVCAQLLMTGGHLIMHELHPFTDMFAVPGDSGYDPEHPLKIVRSYFEPTPWIEGGGLDYVGGTTYAAHEAISFPHTLGETLTAIAASGLALVELREYAEDIAAVFGHLAQAGKIPLSYSLIVAKLAAPLAI